MGSDVAIEKRARCRSCMDTEGPGHVIRLRASRDTSSCSMNGTGAVPPAVSRATRSYVRSQTLGPVVRLQTDRTQYVVELDGHPLATLCDDMVLADCDAEPIKRVPGDRDRTDRRAVYQLSSPRRFATSQRRLQGRRGSCAKGSTSTGTAGVRPTGRHRAESWKAGGCRVVRAPHAGQVGDCNSSTSTPRSARVTIQRICTSSEKPFDGCEQTCEPSHPLLDGEVTHVASR